MTRLKREYLNKTYSNIGDGKNWIENTFQIDGNIVLSEEENNDFSLLYYHDISNNGDSENIPIYYGTYGKCLKWIKNNISLSFDDQFANLKDGDLFKVLYSNDNTPDIVDYYIKTDLGGAIHIITGSYDSFENNNNKYKLEKISDDKKIKLIESIKEL